MGLNLKMPTGPGSNKWAMPSWVVGVGAVDVSAICNITDEGACTRCAHSTCGRSPCARSGFQSRRPTACLCIAISSARAGSWVWSRHARIDRRSQQGGISCHFCSQFFRGKSPGVYCMRLCLCSNCLHFTFYVLHFIYTLHITFLFSTLNFTF